MANSLRVFKAPGALATKLLIAVSTYDLVDTIDESTAIRPVLSTVKPVPILTPPNAFVVAAGNI